MSKSPKRKVSYEQSVALDYGRAVARRNQRQRAAAKDAARREDEDAERAAAAHVHYWRDWSLNEDDVTESRSCANCDVTETRKWRGL